MIYDAHIHTAGTTTAYLDGTTFCHAEWHWHDIESTPEQISEGIEHEYYLEIPHKIKPAKSLTMKPISDIKQPTARAGFKRGQRNGKI